MALVLEGMYFTQRDEDYDLTILQGVDIYKTITLDSSVVPASCALQVRASPSSATAVATFKASPSAGEGTTSVSGQEIRFAMSAAISSTLVAGEDYVYDLEITDSDGYKARYLSGRCTISPEITKV